ncbi:membrane protein [soil metagenome]
MSDSALFTKDTDSFVFDEGHRRAADFSGSKLPQVTLLFWIMKICATTLGETAGDMFSRTMQFGYLASSMLLLAVFLTTLVAQLSARRFHPFLFWALILSTSTAGTTISDFVDRTLGRGYASGSTILAGLLLVVFVAWKLTGLPLSVEHIRSRKTETLYWTAILISNALGTALGDCLADGSSLDFAGGAGVLAFVLALLAILAYTTRISHVLLFWLAFIITRPFGATMGDVLTKEPLEGGLGLGTLGSSAVLFAILFVLVVYTTSKKNWPSGRNPAA